MPTYYGSYVTVATYNRVRAEFVVSLSYPGGSLTTDDTVANIDWTLRLRKHPDDPSGSYCNDTSAYSVTGDDTASGNKAWSLSGPNDTVTIVTGTDTAPLSYGSSADWNVSASVDHAVLSGVCSVSVSQDIPARPYAKPAAPSGLTVTRVSDTQQNLSWTRNATTAAPYSSQEVWRAVDGSSTYTKIATPSGSATSYSDTTTAKNHRYTYKVRAVNSAGSSSYSGTNSQSTTPNNPPAPTWTVDASSNVIVNRPSSPAYVVNQWRVWHAADGIWDASPLGTVAIGTTTFQHTAPNPAQTHQYRLTYLSTDPVLESGYGSASTILQLQSPPNAPTNLAPTLADAAAQIVFTWQHNTTDGSPQRKYQFDHRLVGGSTWTSSGVITSATASRTLAPGYFSNGTQVEYRVRTWGAATTGGADGTGASAWSSTQVITLSTPPSAGISSPSGTWNTQVVTVTWTYFDAESTAQSRWEAQLLDADLNVIETKSANNASTSTAFATPVADGGTYTVKVRVRDGSTLYSEWASETFVVNYDPPPTPVLDGLAWHADDGQVLADLSVGSPGVGERPVDHLRLDRQDELDGTWHIVADDLPNPATVTDYIAPTATTVTYRVTAVSDIGSEASATSTVDTPTTWLFVNYGDGFVNLARWDTDLKVNRAFDPVKVLRRYAGRPKPTVRVGVAEAERYAIAATVFPTFTAAGSMQSGWNEIRDLARDDVICVRDHTGVRLFVTALAGEISDHLDWEGKVSIPLEVVDYDEPVAS